MCINHEGYRIFIDYYWTNVFDLDFYSSIIRHLKQILTENRSILTDSKQKIESYCTLDELNSLDNQIKNSNTQRLGHCFLKINLREFIKISYIKNLTLENEWNIPISLIYNHQLDCYDININNLENVSINYAILKMPNIFEVLHSIPKSDLLTKISIFNAELQLRLDHHHLNEVPTFIIDESGNYERITLENDYNCIFQYLQSILENLILKDLDDQNEINLTTEKYKESIKIFDHQILIHSSSNELHYHLRIIEIILKRLKSINLKIDITRSTFLSKTCTFAGRLLMETDYSIHPYILNKLINLKSPKNRNELKIILDNIYRFHNHLFNCDEIEFTILYLTLENLYIKQMNDQLFYWDLNFEFTFKEIKNRFKNAGKILYNS